MGDCDFNGRLTHETLGELFRFAHEGGSINAESIRARKMLKMLLRAYARILFYYKTDLERCEFTGWHSVPGEYALEGMERNIGVVKDLNYLNGLYEGLSR